MLKPIEQLSELSDMILTVWAVCRTPLSQYLGYDFSIDEVQTYDVLSSEADSAEGQ